MNKFFQLFSSDSQKEHRESDLRWAKLLNAEFGQPLAHIDAGFDGLALYDASAEATGESITSKLSQVSSFLNVDQHRASNLPSAICIVDLLHGKFVNRGLLNLDFSGAVGNGGNGGIGALSDDHNSGALRVLLGKCCHLLGNFGDLLDPPTVGLREGKGLGLISNNIVCVGHNLVKRVLEESWDKWCSEGEHECLEIKD